MTLAVVVPTGSACMQTAKKRSSSGASAPRWPLPP
jgi:hypothetical protein